MQQNTPHDSSSGFQCSLCGETINARLSNCPYCGAVVDPAENQRPSVSPITDSRIEATILKVAARALAASFVAMAMSVAESIALPVFLLLLIVLPILQLRWWLKYRNLQPLNPSCLLARREVKNAAFVWSAVIVVWLLASLILSWRQMVR